MSEPLWITEAEVVRLMNLGEAIDALETGLRMQAEGQAVNMRKTHVVWGDGNTMHAIGAVMPGAGLLGTKTWAHTTGGACPLLIVFDESNGTLLAIIEAFALGQMRTGGMSGVATRWMAAPDADELAVIGTGKQAITQVAAVHAVRPLKCLRIFSPTLEKRQAFAEKVDKSLGIATRVCGSVEEAVEGAPIITTVTRARDAFLFERMVPKHCHVNAIGGISPEREEFDQDLFGRVGLIAADDPDTAMRLGKEFIRRFGDGQGDPAQVRPISELVAAAEPRRPDLDISLFKAMGMGISDMSLGMEILRRAREAGVGKPLQTPVRAAPRLTAGDHQPA